MPWRRSSSRSASVIGAGVLGAGSLMLFPFEVAAGPGPDEALREEQHENEHCQQGPRRQAGERHRKRQQEQHLHVEDQEQDRVEVIVGFELNPRVPGRGQAAFINGVLGFAGLAWLEIPKPQLRHRQQHEWKRHRHREEHGEKRIRRSEEHTSELQSRQYLVCRLLLEKTNTKSMSSRAVLAYDLYNCNGSGGTER